MQREWWGEAGGWGAVAARHTPKLSQATLRALMGLRLGCGMHLKV